ncbi:hypothetical protein L484_013704 [Morus notabilis]|uniref:Uncharacterized protein n=1 Tax=Morus notabilis TaxID=981085 RepID=W9QN26_9ROSA|nr:hypothetical protein L484_013704 [Morus notabilis]
MFYLAVASTVGLAMKMLVTPCGSVLQLRKCWKIVQFGRLLRTSKGVILRGNNVWNPPCSEMIKMTSIQLSMTGKDHIGIGIVISTTRKCQF